MTDVFGRAPKMIAVAAAIVILAGCAGVEERVDQTMQMAQQAQRDAAAAKQTAEAANRAASEAKTMAQNAQRSADAAKRAADQANSCCAANSERLDRMFEKSVRK